MFTRSKAPEVESSQQAQQPAAAKRAQRGGAPSIISNDLTVCGNLISTGDVQIEGRVEGDVRAVSLVVGEQAMIQGDVYAEEATIRGNVTGSIRARKVQLCATCHVEGNILHEALSVEAGAFFEGNCRHSDNPLGDAHEPQLQAARRAAPAPAANYKLASPAPQPAGQSEGAGAQPQAPRATAASFTPLKA